MVRNHWNYDPQIALGFLQAENVATSPQPTNFGKDDVETRSQKKRRFTAEPVEVPPGRAFTSIR